MAWSQTVGDAGARAEESVEQFEQFNDAGELGGGDLDVAWSLESNVSGHGLING